MPAFMMRRPSGLALPGGGTSALPTTTSAAASLQAQLAAAAAAVAPGVHQQHQHHGHHHYQHGAHGLTSPLSPAGVFDLELHNEVAAGATTTTARLTASASAAAVAAAAAAAGWPPYGDGDEDAGTPAERLAALCANDADAAGDGDGIVARLTRELYRLRAAYSSAADLADGEDDGDDEAAVAAAAYGASPSGSSSLGSSPGASGASGARTPADLGCCTTASSSIGGAGADGSSSRNASGSGSGSDGGGCGGATPPPHQHQHHQQQQSQSLPRACSQGPADVDAIARALLAGGYLVQLRDEASAPPEQRARAKDARRCLQQLRHRFIVCVGALGAPALLPEPLVVEPCFREQFVIAQPTPAYAALLAAAPPCFVGPAPRLRAAVALLCGEMAAAFKQQGLPVPPWRSKRAMLSKWAPEQLAALSSKLAAVRDSGAGAAPACCSGHEGGGGGAALAAAAVIAETAATTAAAAPAQASSPSAGALPLAAAGRAASAPAPVPAPAVPAAADRKSTV